MILGTLYSNTNTCPDQKFYANLRNGKLMVAILVISALYQRANFICKSCLKSQKVNWWVKMKTFLKLGICHLKTTIIQSKHLQYGFIVQPILYIFSIFINKRKEPLIHWRSQTFNFIWWYFFGSSQNGIPEIILRGVLRSSRVNLPYQDTPHRFSIEFKSGEQAGYCIIFPCLENPSPNTQ